MLYPPFFYSIKSEEKVRKLCKSGHLRKLAEFIKGRQPVALGGIMDYVQSLFPDITYAQVKTVLAGLVGEGALTVEEKKLSGRELEGYIQELLSTISPKAGNPKRGGIPGRKKFTSTQLHGFKWLFEDYPMDYLSPILASPLETAKILSKRRRALRKKFDAKTANLLLRMGFTASHMEKYNLSPSECKQLLSYGPYEWMETLKEIGQIREENPGLPYSTCKELAIHYKKNWKNIFKLRETIQGKYPNLSAAEVNRLIIAYPNTWEKVLNVAEKIQAENPKLFPSDCKLLAMMHPRGWKEVLKALEKTQNDNPDITSSNCKFLVFRYFERRKEVLKEARRIVGKRKITRSIILEAGRRLRIESSP